MACRRRTLLSLCLALALVAPALQAAQSDWPALTPRERQILAPLEQQWGSMGEERQRRWLALAATYDGLTPAEQGRIRQRMTEWAALSAREREQARERYRSLRAIPPERREILRDKWEQYQSLTPEEKQRIRSGSASGAK